MKKLVLIGALSLGLMSFNAPAEEEVVVDCFEQALDYTIQEGQAFGFNDWSEALEAFDIWYSQCMNM